MTETHPLNSKCKENDDDTDEDGSILFNSISLINKFREYPLRTFLRYSKTLIRIIQQLDLLAVEIDINIVNNLCEQFEMDKDYYQILVK